MMFTECLRLQNKQELVTSFSTKSQLVKIFYLQNILKDKEYSNNPCNEDNLKDSIQDTVFSISTAELLVCN